MSLVETQALRHLAAYLPYRIIPAWSVCRAGTTCACFSVKLTSPAALISPSPTRSASSPFHPPGSPTIVDTAEDQSPLSPRKTPTPNHRQRRSSLSTYYTASSNAPSLHNSPAPVYPGARNFQTWTQSSVGLRYTEEWIRGRGFRPANSQTWFGGTAFGSNYNAWNDEDDEEHKTTSIDDSSTNQEDSTGDDLKTPTLNSLLQIRQAQIFEPGWLVGHKKNLSASTVTAESVHAQQTSFVPAPVSAPPPPEPRTSLHRRLTSIPAGLQGYFAWNSKKEESDDEDLIFGTDSSHADEDYDSEEPGSKRGTQAPLGFKTAPQSMAASSVGRRSLGSGLGGSKYAISNGSTEPELELEKDKSGESSKINSPPTPPTKSTDMDGPTIVSIRRAETSLFPHLGRLPRKPLDGMMEEDDEIPSTPSNLQPLYIGRDTPTPTPSVVTSATRSRTSVRWHGKLVIINVPLENRVLQPLTPKEVEAQYAKFGEKPYVWTPSSEQMSRELFPADSDRYIPTKIEAPRVSIPDKQKWESYVNALREEKLKALGVDLSDILGPPSSSPVPSIGGRTSIPPELQQRNSSSPHPSLPFSNTFSPPPSQVNGSHPPFSHQRHFSQSPMMPPPVSTASPFNKPFHLQRQSMSISRTPPMYGGVPPPGFQQSPQPQNWEPYNTRSSPQPQPTPSSYGQQPMPPTWSPQMDMRNIASPGAFKSFSPQPPGFVDPNGLPQSQVDYSMGGHDPRPMFGRHQHRPSVQWQNLHQQVAQHQMQLQQQQQQQQQAQLLQQQQQQHNQLQNQLQQPLKPRLEDLVEADEPEETVSSLPTSKPDEQRVTPIVVPVPKHGMNRLSVHLRQEMQGGKDEDEEEDIKRESAGEPNHLAQSANDGIVEQVVEAKANVLETADEPSLVKVVTSVKDATTVPETELQPVDGKASSQLTGNPAVTEEKEVVILPIKSEFETNPTSPILEETSMGFLSNPTTSPLAEQATEDSGDDTDPTKPSSRFHTRENSNISNISSRLPPFLRGTPIHSRHNSQMARAEPELPNTRNHVSIPLIPAQHTLSVQNGHMNGALSGGFRDDLSDGAQTNISDIHTNPSEPPSPRRRHFSGIGAESKWVPDAVPHHERKESSLSNVSNQFAPASQNQPTSKLNVGAPEFKFGGFNPNAAVFSPPTTHLAPVKPVAPVQINHSRNSSGAQFNVDAPVFQPSSFALEPGNQVDSSFSSEPSSDSKGPISPFSFFSKGFNPVVPIFTPPKIGPVTSMSNTSTPIFSYRTEDFISPPTTSKKAVVTPLDPEDTEEELGWAAGGRPSFLRDNRSGKKGRFIRGRDDGDDVPMFAPSPGPLMREMEREIERRHLEEEEEERAKNASPKRALEDDDKESLAYDQLPQIPTTSSPSSAPEVLEHRDRGSIMESYVGNETDTRVELTKSEKYLFKISTDATNFAEARPASASDHYEKRAKSDVFGVMDQEYQHLEDLAIGQALMGRKQKEDVPIPSDEKEATVPGDVVFDPEAAEFMFTDATEKGGDQVVLSSAPIAERLPMPSAQELNDTFNFMFTQENAETEAADGEEDEELHPEEEDSDDLQREVQLNPPVESAFVASPSSSSESIQPAPALPEYIPPPEKTKFASQQTQAENRVRANAPSPASPERANTFITHVPQTPAERGIPTIDPLEPDSDWDSLLPDNDTQDSKLRSRASFFDTRVESMVGGILETRLDPVEKQLGAIYSALQNFTPLRKRMVTRESAWSDADDEEDADDDSSNVLRSPGKRKEDKKLERIRSVVMDALATREFATSSKPIEPIHDTVKGVEEIKIMMTSFLETQKQKDEERLLVIDKGVKKEEGNGVEEGAAATIEILQMRISALEKTLEAGRKAQEGEVNAKKVLQDSISELERRLNISTEREREAKERADEMERKFKEVEDKRNKTLTQAQMRAALLEGAHVSLQKSVGDLTVTKANLEGQLADAKAKSDKIVADMEAAVAEASELRRAIPVLEASLEESRRLHDGSNTRLEDLQDKVIKAAAEVENKQARWRERNELQKNRIQTLETRLDTELRMREGREEEMKRLEAEEKNAIRLRIELEHVLKMKERMEADVLRMQDEEREAIRLRVEVEQVRRDNLKMEALVDRLRAEVIDKERAVVTERDTSSHEALKITLALQAQLEAARSETESVKVNLETEITKIMMETETSKERLKMLHDEVMDSKDAFIREMKTSHEVAMQHEAHQNTAKLEDQHQRYENMIDSLKEKHRRDIENAIEDIERERIFLKEQMEVQQAQQSVYTDKIEVLENQLEIAKKAAQAAVIAAQGSKSPAITRQHVPYHATETKNTPSAADNKALRESLAVLQEQLQEKEATIETQAEEIESLRKSPAAKEVEHENIFLRELLSVRIGELEEIVRQLSKPQFDKVTVRNAAIRLKANLEMEQQERERNAALSASTEQVPTTTVGSLYGIANRGLSGALGGLRKGKAKYDDPGYISVSASTSPAMARDSSDQGSVQQSPSRPTSRQNFLTGLLTPPISLSRPAALASTLAKDRFVGITSRVSSDAIAPRPSPSLSSSTSTLTATASSSRVRPRAPSHASEKSSTFVYDEDANDNVESSLSEPQYFVEEDEDIADALTNAQVNMESIVDDDDDEDEDDLGVPGFAMNSPYMRR
ncbi:hypothetical protein AOL_s00173g344 [Orbilia oligospora ATCC 24927]|uniref:Uncharacterized protein n=1 Tax=Arthrobotrys oligospora (strain ATCC 24927 / CBS 115.81 / DSM 1491) TaxID=756982 RepID=G1XPH6_ARTOA|nr:hypothetical protein AOL_s00173g344 [Orbilia oligospora ATCC 24927]EGX45243.1 hypothetical protein AOL_s00173g344 [Orbilia oligospora ATCC 24927]